MKDEWRMKERMDGWMDSITSLMMIKKKENDHQYIDGAEKKWRFETQQGMSIIIIFNIQYSIINNQ